MGIFDGQTSILASSRCPAKGIRQIGLFKVESGGKRRLLHCCHRSNDGGHARKERETMLILTYLKHPTRQLDGIQQGEKIMAIIKYWQS